MKYRIVKTDFGDMKSDKNVYHIQYKKFLFWHYMMYAVAGGAGCTYMEYVSYSSAEEARRALEMITQKFLRYE